MKRLVKPFRFTHSIGFWILIALIIYLDGYRMVLQGVAACALHEMGHWLIIKLLGGRVCALRLSMLGAEMQLDAERPLSYGREAMAALAGPVVNLILALVSAKLNWYLFAGINLCFGLLNLLPIFPLDGGRALSCLLSARWPTAACVMMRVIAVVMSGILLGIGLTAWTRWGNLTLLLAAIWLMIKAILRAW